MAFGFALEFGRELGETRGEEIVVALVLIAFGLGEQGQLKVGRARSRCGSRLPVHSGSAVIFADFVLGAVGKLFADRIGAFSSSGVECGQQRPAELRPEGLLGGGGLIPAVRRWAEAQGIRRSA